MGSSIRCVRVCVACVWSGVDSLVKARWSSFDSCSSAVWRWAALLHAL